MLGNQRVSYNKAGLGYEPKNNIKNFDNIYKTKTTSHYKTLKFKYCNKEGHIAMLCFIKKNNERK